jgi:hypothetical protein
VSRALPPVVVDVLEGRPLPPRDRSQRPAPPAFAPWEHRAACAGQPHEHFTEAASQAEAEELAARYCRPCPVTLQCLATGRWTRGWGLWGGAVLRDRVLAPDRRLAVSA